MFFTTIAAISYTLIAFLMATAAYYDRIAVSHSVGYGLSAVVALLALLYWARTVAKVTIFFRECNASKPGWDELGDLLARYMGGDKPDQQTHDRIKAARTEDEIVSKV